ncbi:MAG: hypothetical protein ACWIPI_04610 [Polaribacter sp.]
MKILSAIDRLKNSDEEPIKLLIELEDIYKEAKERQKQVCPKCEEWIKMELPTDCLSKPDYCVKNENDSILTIWYESIQEDINF